MTTDPYPGKPGPKPTIAGARRRSYDLGTNHDEILERWRAHRGLRYPSEALREIVEWVGRREKSWPKGPNRG